MLQDNQSLLRRTLPNHQVQEPSVAPQRHSCVVLNPLQSQSHSGSSLTSWTNCNSLLIKVFAFVFIMIDRHHCTCIYVLWLCFKISNVVFLIILLNLCITAMFKIFTLPIDVLQTLHNAIGVVDGGYM